ncbi:NADP-dependent oxidoreductase [Bradyrhizobium sp.]|uniref:NADP-dependent oxidoreductase n=1 Tax=Bradyrhizobium sp. TaxID=376 RepID=UPI003C40FDD1
MQTTETTQRIVLASRPVGAPTLENFRLEELPIGQPGPGQMLLRTLWLSLDPYMRGRMSDAPSYAKPVGIGDVMEGGTVSEVLTSNAPRFAKGDIVVGRTGWQTYALSDGSGLQKVDPGRAPISAALGVLGMPGMTAYVGLLEIGKPAVGETVVVAAASGAVGSVVGQIARIKGARAVGIAGGPDKCRFVIEKLGFDACIDHRAPDLAARLASACPKGIDVYFENVGGAVFEAVFPLLNPFARIPVCGLISMYNATSLSPGPILLPHLMRAILTKRLTFRGFIVSDFAARYGDFVRDVSAWVGERRIKYREDIVEGLENTPRALIGLLRGENFGKLLVRVAPAST